MSNLNKKRLLDTFLNKYPFKFELQFCDIYRYRLNLSDDNYVGIGKLFDDYQDYIIDFFSSEL